MGTINLLEALKKLNSVKSVVVVTTDKVYKNMENEIGYSEDDPLGGHDPYSSSKAAVELAVESWRNSFFANNELQVGIATARAGNVIGGGDWSENRLLPDYFRAYLTNQVFEFRNPYSVRPWQHVLDVSYGYALLGKKLYHESEMFSESFNFASDSNIEYDTRFIIQYLNSKLNFHNYIVQSFNESLRETATLKLLSYKAFNTLGWRNQLSIEDSLDLTIQYYKDSSPDSSRKLVIFQIREYLGSFR
jgi:CDP-glucose 4,6-dehydratase